MTTSATSDVRADAPIGPIVVAQTELDDLVRWSAAIDDYSPIHYDTQTAEERGFPGPVVNGPWKAAVLTRMLTNWLAGRGQVQRLSCRYSRADVVGTTLTFGGQVTDSFEEDDAVRLECEVWIENADGERSVTGAATMRLDKIAEEVAAGGLPVQQLKRVLGVGHVAAEFTYRVDANDVARFRSAVHGANAMVDAPLPAPGDVAPPTFYAALDPVERRDLQLEGILDGLPYPKVGGGNAFNEVEYVRPIRAGDVITVRTSYEDVYERAGRAGRLLFRVRVNDLIDSAGQRVATTRMGHVLAFDLGTAQ